MRNLKKGDIVWLKSGSPKMTVQQIELEKNCKCIWFQYGEIQTHDFDCDTLTLSDPFESLTASIPSSKK
jgi:uncharacterized protein YodC (DUF2158 family)